MSKRRPQCPDHPGDPLSYNEARDSWVCEGCDRWVSAACSDPECSFCSGRPARPSLEPINRAAEDPLQG